LLNWLALRGRNSERAVRQHGLTGEQVQAAVRITAVVHAAAAVLGGKIAEVGTLRAA